jgi:hypothetical protein
MRFTSTPPRSRRPSPLDLLDLNGRDLRKLPLIEGKAHLKKLIGDTDIQFSESFEVDGKKMYAHARRVRLEGVVPKVRDSAYNSGRGNNWVKKTCVQRETLVIAGSALEWDGIYVGRRKGEDLIYAGKVDHGFDKASAADLQKRLTPLIRKTQPLHQAHRAQGHLGRARAYGRDRIPGEVRARQSSAPILSRRPMTGHACIHDEPGGPFVCGIVTSLHCRIACGAQSPRCSTAASAPSPVTQAPLRQIRPRAGRPSPRLPAAGALHTPVRRRSRYLSLHQIPATRRTDQFVAESRRGDSAHGRLSLNGCRATSLLLSN